MKLLLFVNDLDGRLREAIIKSSIEVVGLSRTEGDRLMASVDASTTGSVPLRAVSRPDTDYLYDLVRTWKGRIPANPVYAPTAGQLARVETSFHNPTGREVYENRYDVHPWTAYQVGTNRLSTAGAHRTDYVSTDSTFSWTEEGQLQSLSYSASGSVTYPAGSTTDVEWFGPVVRPRINGSVQLPARTGDEVDVIIPSWGDSGGGHANYVAFGSSGTTQETSLYRGDTLLAEGGAGVSATVPAKKGTYRLVHTATRTATAAFPTRPPRAPSGRSPPRRPGTRTTASNSRSSRWTTRCRRPPTARQPPTPPCSSLRCTCRAAPTRRSTPAGWNCPTTTAPPGRRHASAAGATAR